MNEFNYIVRVDTKAGFRKTYSFDTLEEANAFVIECEDTIVKGPTKIVPFIMEEAEYENYSS